MINKIFATTHILSKECQKVNLHLQTILDFATATQVSLSEDKDDFENFFKLFTMILFHLTLSSFSVENQNNNSKFSFFDDKAAAGV